MSTEDLPELAPPFSLLLERVFKPGLESERRGIFRIGMDGRAEMAGVRVGEDAEEVGV